MKVNKNGAGNMAVEIVLVPIWVAKCPAHIEQYNICTTIDHTFEFRRFNQWCACHVDFLQFLLNFDVMIPLCMRGADGGGHRQHRLYLWGNTKE